MGLMFMPPTPSRQGHLASWLQPPCTSHCMINLNCRDSSLDDADPDQIANPSSHGASATQSIYRLAPMTQSSQPLEQPRPPSETDARHSAAGTQEHREESRNTASRARASLKAFFCPEWTRRGLWLLVPYSPIPFRARCHRLGRRWIPPPSTFLPSDTSFLTINRL